MSPAPEDLEKTMSTAVIPERWRVVYEAMKPLADKQGASFQFARDKCALIESLGTAESLVRDLARALQDFPEFPYECSHDEEAWYCDVCSTSYRLAVEIWKANRDTALSR